MITFLLHVAQIGVFYFSFLIFVRNLDESLAKRRLNPKIMPKIVTAYVLLGIFGAVFADYFVFLMLLNLFFGVLFVRIVQKLRKTSLERAVLSLVQQLVFNISSGNSFKRAYFQSLVVAKSHLRNAFEALWDVEKLNIDQFPGPNMFELSQIIRQCRKNSTKSLEICRQFRENLVQQEKFQQKMNAGLSQIRTQLAFVSLFYFILVGFFLRFSLLQEFLGWFFLSFSLFSLGSLWIWYLPRSFKWSN